MTTLVIGEALVDVVRENGRTNSVPGGSPANVALGLARLGREVTLHTTLGDDEAGRAVRVHLEESGVTLTPESATTAPTTIATADIDDNGDASYSFAIEWDPAAIDPRGAGIVHTGSLGAWLPSGAAAVDGMLAAARATGALVTFDPNIRTSLIADDEAVRALIAERLAASDVVKMSDEDAAWLYPGTSEDEVLDIVLAAGPRIAALTRGGEGAVIATREHRISRPSAPVTVVDTIGAGDTFMTILVDEAEGLVADPSEATLGRVLDRALRAAAITVSRPGPDLPWARDME